ncbi:DNA-binding GntR family transcriptional regulator [Mesorhizobium sp. J18]|uniref:GntR family transcriptional regulator n=1 Tax=Mesorhizobium sp. J18 TaxID=935263 RepID=UPI001198E230|nr:GntR family transcriptional regulator [Mesorhizobium sp. J18]TWG96381.1 DNA-binding GntR family transcriptional regulator [Mesorhizobium sp. J18]
MDQPTVQSRHADLAGDLAREIAEGRYPLGSRFPAESELQERFGVGRHTIREALKILTEQGLLGRRRKTGTFVLSLRPVPHYVHSLRDIRSLFDFARNTLLTIQHEGFVSITSRKPREFYGTRNKRWLRIAGVRSTRSDNQPLCWSEVMVPDRFAPDRSRIRGNGDAIYEAVLQEYGLKLEYVEQKVTATTLPAQLATVLSAEPDEAALLVERRYVAHTGDTFEVSHNLYPADRYSIYSIIRQRT